MFRKTILFLVVIPWNLTADQIVSDRARYVYEVFYSKLVEVQPYAVWRICSRSPVPSEVNRTCPSSVSEVLIPLDRFEALLKTYTSVDFEVVERVLVQLESTSVTDITHDRVERPVLTEIFRTFRGQQPGAEGGGASGKACYQCSYEGTYVGKTKFGGYCLDRSREFGERWRGPNEEEVKSRANRKAAAFCDFPNCGCAVDRIWCEKLESPTVDCTVF